MWKRITKFFAALDKELWKNMSPLVLSCSFFYNMSNPDASPINVTEIPIWTLKNILARQDAMADRLILYKHMLE